MSYLPERTVRYKTYVKTALVESLIPVFQNHLDEKLKSTKVTIDMPKERQSFPSVVVRFYESEIKNAGVGHEEVIADENNKGWKFKHYFYTGSIEFGIYALSSLDRDLISDTLVQTITMGDLADYTNNFFNRIYPPDSDLIPDSVGHFININSDEVSAVGEASSDVPWGAEDDLIYTVSYRVAIFGEFYSLPQDAPWDFVQKVFLYPYAEDAKGNVIGEKPTGLENESSWKNA
jgi:hypothetical protein